MTEKISHSGVIESIESGCVHVRIVQTSACAACKAASYCNASESREKLVDVYCDAPSGSFQPGQPVTVVASREVAARALLLGFGVPFVVMVGVLALVLALTGSEGLAAAGGIVALAPYYGMLYLFRDRVRDKLSFSIETMS